MSRFVNRFLFPVCVLIACLAPFVVRAQTSAAEVARLLAGRDIYYDDYGLIVHSDGGGDTAQREGWYWLGVWLRQNTLGLQPWAPTRALTFDQVLRLLELNGDGVFYRHPFQFPFNNPRGK